MKDIPSKELSALLHLLDDPDREVYRHVTDKLIAYGTGVIPKLEDLWEQTFDPNLHYRLEELIHIIQYENLVQEMATWAREKSDDLLKGALLVSRYQYPDLDRVKVYNAIDRMSREIWIEMNYNLTPLEQVNVFNHVLFSINGFSGNTANINDPQNSYLNIVLDNKKGNPVSLGILYLVLAAKIKVPVYGVKLPQHFILSYQKTAIEPADTESRIRSNTLFYLNPFNKGIVFSRDDITLFLKKLNLAPRQEHYLPCTNIEIIQTLLKGLIHSYELAGITDKVRELKRLLETLD